MDITEGFIRHKSLKGVGELPSMEDFILEFCALLDAPAMHTTPLPNGILLCAEGRMFNGSLAFMNCMLLTVECDEGSGDEVLRFRGVSGGGVDIQNMRIGDKQLHQVHLKARETFHQGILSQLVKLAKDRKKTLVVNSGVV